MTRDEALGRAVSSLAAAGIAVDDLVIIRDLFVTAGDPFSTRPHDHWFLAFEPLLADPDFHPNGVIILVYAATGAVERPSLL